MYKFIILLLGTSLLSCTQKTKERDNKQETVSLRSLPDTSFWHKAVAPFDTSGYVVLPKHMQEYYDMPGEFGYIAEGKDYGFTSISVFMANTQPGGGPPLHTHDMEEVHVVNEGTVLYYINGKQFTAEGPYIVRIPAGMPHAFMNTGKKPVNVNAILPSKDLSYNELGRNPLIKDTSVYHPVKKGS